MLYLLNIDIFYFIFLGEEQGVEKVEEGEANVDYLSIEIFFYSLNR